MTYSYCRYWLVYVIIIILIYTGVFVYLSDIDDARFVSSTLSER